jgi:hypothetical protein
MQILSRSIRFGAILRPVALALALLSASALWATNKGPDSGGYSATDSTVYSFIAINGAGGANVLGGTDDAVALVSLPFPFQFYGNSYSLLCISSNGQASFVTSSAACVENGDFANTELSLAGPPGDLPAILPYWTDLTLEGAGSAVYYQTQGSVGSRRFIVEWYNASVAATNSAATFEAVLTEGSNQILFQYLTVDSGQGNAATVGIRNSGGQTSGKQIEWSYNAAVLSNNYAILFTPPGGSQQSVNVITTSPAGLTVTIDGTPYPTPKIVTWIPGSQHTAIAASQTIGGTQETFTSWSPGGANPTNTITAQSTGTTYTATFATQYQLTTATNPANNAGGTISGAGFYAPGTIVAVQAAAAAGYAFVNFSGDVNSTANPVSVTMNTPLNVVANFRSTANPTLAASVTGKANGTGSQRIWTIALTNHGAGTATLAQITGFTLTQTTGTPCSPAASLVSSLPAAVGTIAPAANATAQITLNFVGCTGTPVFTVLVQFSANSGAYTGSTTIFNQTM